MPNQQIVIDYGCDYFIDFFIIKNTHNAYFNDRGTKGFVLRMSMDNVNWGKVIEDELDHVFNTGCNIPTVNLYVARWVKAEQQRQTKK